MNNIEKRRAALKIAQDYYGGSRDSMAAAFGVTHWSVDGWFSKEGNVPFKTAYKIDLDTNSKARIEDLIGYPVKRLKKSKEHKKDKKESIKEMILILGGINNTAEKLGVKTNGVRTWIRSGSIPFEKAYIASKVSGFKIKISDLIPETPVEIYTHKNRS